jgi:DNA-binding SARP family transcriptional activator
MPSQTARKPSVRGAPARLRSPRMLRIRVLGRIEVERDGVALPQPAGRPARSLLGWLALHPGTHARSRVAATLWPDVLDTSARASLRTALSTLRQSLGDAADEVLRAGREEVGLTGPPLVSVDALEFDLLLAEGRTEQALALSAGELLPGVEDDWALAARDRQRERESAAMAALAEAADRSGDLAAALSWARRRADLDPYDEPAHRDLIARLARAGDRAGALAANKRFTERLQRELGVAPAAVTRELANRLREDEPGTATEAPSRGAGALPMPSPLDPRRWRSAFVGRAEALARLDSAWAAQRGGAVGVALVVGEAGIGKTRLAAQFAHELHSAGAVVLAGRAEEQLGEPYQPLMEALRAANAAPEVAPTQSDERAERIRLFEALAGALEHVAGGHPLALVIDDLQWADAGTLEFLRELAVRGTAMPTIVIATSRPGEVAAGTRLARVIADIARNAPLTRVSLGGLTLDETAALVSGRDGAEGADVEGLVRRTGGNPFFVEALVDAGLAGGGELPDGVAELVAGRVDWLGPELSTLLQAGAILGAEFDIQLAAATAGLTPEEALGFLDAAVAAHLVVPAAEGSGRVAFVHALVQEALAQMPTPGERAALHARAVDALAPRVAAGSDQGLASSARHALAAVPLIPYERAAELAERAGAALLSAFASADAAALLAQAVSASDAADAPPVLRARLLCAYGEALHAADRPREARPLFAEAAELARRSGDGELLARAALGRAGPAVTIRRVEREQVAALEEALSALPEGATGLRAQVEARLAIELAYDPDHERRERLSAAALADARAEGDPRTLAAALSARHVALWGPDHTPERLGLADQMIALARRAGDPALELQGRTWRIVDLDELGDGQSMESEIDAYAETAARSGLSAYAWYVPAWRSVRAGLAGRPDEARKLQRRAVELGRRVADPNAQFAERLHWTFALADDRFLGLDLDWQEEHVRNSPAGWAYRAMYTWILLTVGREEDARRELADQRRQGFPRGWPRDTNWLSAMKELSEVAILLEDRELGAELTELLEPFRDRMVTSARSLMDMGSAAGVLARLAVLRGDLPGSIELFEEAIGREERAGAAIWAVRHRGLLGEALIAAGNEGRGRPLLDRVAEQAHELGLEALAERYSNTK